MTPAAIVAPKTAPPTVPQTARLIVHSVLPTGNTKFRLSSDDDGQIVFNGGLDADGTTGAPGVNINRNTTTDVDFQSAGFYQIDVIYQESGGNTGVTLQAQLAGINGGALSK